MNKENYIFHTDPGHGWLAVKRDELRRLKILNQISSCSYQKGLTVYLEEDCDASLFIKAKKDAGEEFDYRESHQENTPIRSYQRFTF